MTKITSTLENALIWHSLGIATIPVLARDKRPALESWKRYQTELPRLRELETWFGSGRYNLAVITGWRGLVVLDWDDRAEYVRWIAMLDDATAGALLSTYRVETQRGHHFYLFSREETATTKGNGWDLKAAGGCVLAPPSIHPSGHVYWSDDPLEAIWAIDSIWNFIEKPPPAPISSCIAQDPFDIAMRPSLSPNCDLAAIKAACPPARVLGIAQNGRVKMINCPLPTHADSRASFAVYSDHVHCFGCNFHGDGIDLYAALHGLDLVEALAELGNL